MKTRLYYSAFFTLLLAIGASGQQKYEAQLIFTPMSHATFVISTQDLTVVVDPVGEASDFNEFPEPDLILITDIHGDHLSPETVEAVKGANTVIISPQAVYDKLQQGDVLNNGQKTAAGAIEIEAIPMYNLTEDRLQFHPKGRGNGYLLTIEDQRIYISGDTEDIPEMRKMKDIDYAFICMNLPYTMTVEQAASAILEMKPRVVIPYHYRGTDGFSDLEKFQTLVSQNKKIEVLLLDWYK